MAEAADTAMSLDVAGVDDASLLDGVEELQVLQARLRALECRLIRAVHERDAAAEWCGRSTRSWLIEDLRLAPGDAGRRMQLARTLPLLPGTSAALEDGRISAEHALVIGKGTLDAPVEDQPL